MAEGRNPSTRAFLVLTPLHLWYNWSAFVGYCKRKTAAAREMPIPAIIAAAAAVLLFLMSLGGIPPVSWIHDAHEAIKFSWRSDLPPEDRDRVPGGKGKHRRERPVHSE